MSTYRNTCKVCGDTYETECWEPIKCPFCEVLELRRDKERLDWLETQVRILPAQRGAQATLHASVMVIGAKNVREAIDMAAMPNVES